MKTRIVIAYLFVLVFILYGQIILARALTVAPRVCETLRADGYLFDRFDAGRGDVHDAQGNIVAVNVSGATILRVCYGIDGQLQRVSQLVVCGGCAPMLAQTPGIKY